MEEDYIVGYTLFGARFNGFKTYHRHFSTLEGAERFASNVNIKDSSKIYVNIEAYKKLEEDYKILDHECSRLEKKEYDKEDKYLVRIKELEEEKKELKNKNMELKNTYIKVAKHQDRIGHQELAEYMLAQIELIPTFTTWEDYYDFVPKQEIRDIVDECIPIGVNLFTGEKEYQPNANANSFLTHEILELLEERNK